MPHAQPRVIVIVNRHSIESKFGMANLTKFPMLSLSVVRLRQRSPLWFKEFLHVPLTQKAKKVWPTPSPSPAQVNQKLLLDVAAQTTPALLVPVATPPISILFLKSECFCILVLSFAMMPVLSCFL